MKRSIFIPATFVAVGVLALTRLHPARADDAADLKALIHKFYETYAQKNLNEHLALWSTEAKDLTTYRNTAQQLLDANDNLQVKQVTILKQNIQRDRARLQVYSDITATTKSGAPSPDFGKRVTNFECVKQDKVWKVVRVSDAKRDLVEALLTAPERRERQRLLEQDRAIVAPDIVNTLNQLAEATARDGKLDEALHKNDVAREVAAFLGGRPADAPPTQVKFGATREEGYCWMYRGLIYAISDKDKEAHENYQRALTIFREAKDAEGEALTLNNLGTLQHRQGNVEEAAKSLEASLKLARASGNKAVEAFTLSNLGAVREQLKDLPGALSAFEGSAKAYREAGSKFGEARALVSVGNTQRKLKKLPEALAAYQASLTLRRELQDRVGEADV
ncbi:MAG: tetratricopeptide repeat protein, partial [Abditibacteriales bacterium]|nr:tetratricopeptide repeat protein [Abditibacteriales bacterium]MDW8368344.1 tetratricopeptide repeat protein [Abditibacteriales bacterium]